jgi:hypothetical protein
LIRPERTVNKARVDVVCVGFVRKFDPSLIVGLDVAVAVVRIGLGPVVDPFLETKSRVIESLILTAQSVIIPR